MDRPKGKLIAIGGNEDKGSYPNPKHKKKYYLDFFELGILKRFLSEIPARNPAIEVITTASLIPEEVGERYESAFAILGCENVNMMHIREDEDALKPEYLERIRKADGVMFSGGDQSRLTRIFGETEFLQIIKDRYWNEDFVVAGTSAGAMAMSEIMIKGGSSTEALLRGSVKMGHGFGLINGVIIDSHFVIRGRFGRLMEAVVTHPKTVGIGLGEDTGVLITEGHMIETIGSNLVVVVDGHGVEYTNINDIENGRPVAIAGMMMHVLAKGNVFNINSRAFYKDMEDVEKNELASESSSN
ncbi:MULTISPECIES: cyanophycinase [Pontibacter]|uniref:Cyanophycinase n=1 Tax=Pontibacter lucknowensis TaxID=1077936 RepID=A0A1N6WZ45_9BACT|nr:MULTISPECIES: cyanophycinase [Pontibacter]EJF08339.1 cyanophycinase [Pontibacter sp. BAB1700]SIQ95352.1 cyanophycinase [Pontibacter lucknowensis]